MNLRQRRARAATPELGVIGRPQDSTARSSAATATDQPNGAASGASLDHRRGGRKPKPGDPAGGWMASGLRGDTLRERGRRGVSITRIM
ncbi:MAG: hypothetical protein ACRERU_16160, partial [Methylococcales bacterium]